MRLPLEVFKKFNEWTKVDLSVFKINPFFNSIPTIEKFKYRGVTFYHTYNGFFLSKSFDLSLTHYYKQINKKQYEYVKQLVELEKRGVISKKYDTPSLFPKLD